MAPAAALAAAMASPVSTPVILAAASPPIRSANGRMTAPQATARRVPLATVPNARVVIAEVAAGRNLAVLVEAAVRNTVLQLRGIDTYKEFTERHQRAMERGSL